MPVGTGEIDGNAEGGELATTVGRDEGLGDGFSVSVGAGVGTKPVGVAEGEEEGN